MASIFKIVPEFFVTFIFTKTTHLIPTTPASIFQIQILTNAYSIQMRVADILLFKKACFVVITPSRYENPIYVNVLGYHRGRLHCQPNCHTSYRYACTQQKSQNVLFWKKKFVTTMILSGICRSLHKLKVACIIWL